MSRGASRDAGMRAVARVRGVREQDSRIGLQQALREQRVLDDQAAELRARIDRSSGFTAGTAASYLALRASLDAVAQVLRRTEADRATAQTVSEAAYSRWQVDKANLSAVETLLDRRAAERRAERGRQEARELDDIAAQRWQRRQGGDPA